MKITVIGVGYVGLTAGTCLAELGNTVTCVDIDEEKIKKLNNGQVPIYEPGLKEMIERNVRENRLFFTTDKEGSIQSSVVIFIAVGTPLDEDHKADLRFVKIVAADIGKLMNSYKIIVNKSTVPVGTADIVEKIIRENQKENIEFDVVSNPEFLREGEAINDFLNPDRIVIGAKSEKAKGIMQSIYGGIVRADKPILFTDVRSAELIKYASNAMLATRISFMNEIAQLCEKVGADVKMVAKGIGLDSRIGPRFLQAGAGYGGSCFGKDIRALAQTMKEHDIDNKILTAIEDVNQHQRKLMVSKVKKLVPDLKEKHIAVWGLAFKPKTDDMREAPSIFVINELQKHGAKVRAFDPEAQNVAKKMLKDVVYFNCPYEALKDAHALIIMTEWNEFRDIDKDKIINLLKEPNIIDGRNIYEPDEMKKSGFNYEGFGR